MVLHGSCTVRPANFWESSRPTSRYRAGSMVDEVELKPVASTWVGSSVLLSRQVLFPLWPYEPVKLDRLLSGCGIIDYGLTG